MVAIKNAIVPPSCYFCPMTNDGFYLCKANNPYRQLEDDCEERRPEWCPLVPVPPHGDLIDRKALLADTTDMLHSMMVFGGARVYTSDAIKNAPTIIPAEEEDS